jgi:hypothetical protein
MVSGSVIAMQGQAPSGHLLSAFFAIIHPSR